VVLLEQEEDGGLRTLTRHLIAFRVVSKHYKQADKAHRLRLDEARDLATKLRRTGFRVRNTRHCGHYPVSRAHTALLGLVGFLMDLGNVLVAGAVWEATFVVPWLAWEAPRPVGRRARMVVSPGLRHVIHAC
jgi:hypothetical protein